MYSIVTLMTKVTHFCYAKETFLAHLCNKCGKFGSNFRTNFKR